MITCKQLTTGHLRELKLLILLFKEVFEMNDFQLPDEPKLQQLLDNNYFLVFAAMQENAVIGGLTAYILPSYYSGSSEVYIYDLAVKPGFQRKGVGRNLLQELTGYCRQNNYKEFFVQADEADVHALEFYRVTGGSPEKVIHFNYPVR
jgi:aminoglycoside 3-N-acetyltransferase I